MELETLHLRQDGLAPNKASSVTAFPESKLSRGPQIRTDKQESRAKDEPEAAY